MPYYRCAACGLVSYSAAAHSSALLCPTCSAPLRDAPKLSLVPGSMPDVGYDFNVGLDAPGEARRALLALALPQITRENVALIVTELVANSVRHAELAADERIRVEMTNGPGVVRLVVRDGGHGFVAPPPQSDELLECGGRGLLIVDALSQAWGVSRENGGCAVWCEIVLDGHRPAVNGAMNGGVRKLVPDSAART